MMGIKKAMLPKPTALAHSLLAKVLRPGERVLDATAGNGHDTEFLARAVGSDGHVLAIDIQAAALAATRARCHQAGLAGQVTLRQTSHAAVADEFAQLAWPPGCLGAAMFNLGYLPGGEKSHITRTDTTLPALAATLAWLRPGGMLTIVCYPGHPGGDAEARAVEAWAAGLPVAKFLVARYGMLNLASAPPFLLAIQSWFTG